jgi:xanthine dehydrogenase YagS FAD-binding subunit
VAGDNRHHAILGGAVCFHVYPGDTAVALAALNATVVTNKKSVAIGDFIKVLGPDLAVDEIVTEIQVPAPAAGAKQTFIKYMKRKAIDFAFTSVATVITSSGGNVSDARIVLGAVAPMPYRATGAEDAIKGKAINETNAAAAADAAVVGAMPLSHNSYKLQTAKALVKRAIMA